MRSIDELSTDALYTQLLGELRAAPQFDRARDVVEALDGSDPATYQRMLREELTPALNDWRANVSLSAVRFYFAGTEIGPWIPSAVWSTGYARYDWDGERFREREALFREGPGFELHSLDEHLYQWALDNASAELDIFDDVRRLFVLHAYRTIQTVLADADDFARPFRLFAMGGHDEPTELLHEM